MQYIKLWSRSFTKWLNFLKSRSEMKSEYRLKTERYVGTTIDSAGIQMYLLKLMNLRRNAKVLEVGCGALHAAEHLVPFLKRRNYVGIDPNEWLRKPRLKSIRWRILLLLKRPRFLSNSSFSALSTGISFDYVLSHSVLSHAASFQLESFLKNISASLKTGGFILASIRLAEGNRFGSLGSPDNRDTNSQTWVYPGVTFFEFQTVKDMAEKWGYHCEIVPEFTAIMVNVRPEEFHDWLIFRKLI
jgi:SAM-dependent methyltransferase